MATPSQQFQELHNAIRTADALRWPAEAAAREETHIDINTGRATAKFGKHVDKSAPCDAANAATSLVMLASPTYRLGNRLLRSAAADPAQPPKGSNRENHKNEKKEEGESEEDKMNEMKASTRLLLQWMALQLAVSKGRLDLVKLMVGGASSLLHVSGENTLSSSSSRINVGQKRMRDGEDTVVDPNAPTAVSGEDGCTGLGWDPFYIPSCDSVRDILTLVNKQALSRLRKKLPTPTDPTTFPPPIISSVASSLSRSIGRRTCGRSIPLYPTSLSAFHRASLGNHIGIVQYLAEECWECVCGEGPAVRKHATLEGVCPCNPAMCPTLPFHGKALPAILYPTHLAAFGACTSPLFDAMSGGRHSEALMDDEMCVMGGYTPEGISMRQPLEVWYDALFGYDATMKARQASANTNRPSTNISCHPRRITYRYSAAVLKYLVRACGADINTRMLSKTHSLSPFQLLLPGEGLQAYNTPYLPQLYKTLVKLNASLNVRILTADLPSAADAGNGLLAGRYACLLTHLLMIMTTHEYQESRWSFTESFLCKCFTVALDALMSADPPCQTKRNYSRPSQKFCESLPKVNELWVWETILLALPLPSSRQRFEHHRLASALLRHGLDPPKNLALWRHLILAPLQPRTKSLVHTLLDMGADFSDASFEETTKSDEQPSEIRNATNATRRPSTVKQSEPNNTDSPTIANQNLSLRRFSEETSQLAGMLSSNFSRVSNAPTCQALFTESEYDHNWST